MRVKHISLFLCEPEHCTKPNGTQLQLKYLLTFVGKPFVVPY